MRVTTGPVPAGEDNKAPDSWWSANSIDLRVGPGLGSCVVYDTQRNDCDLFRYAGHHLRLTTQFGWSWCAGVYGTSDGTDANISRDAADAYCAQQMILTGFIVTDPDACPTAPYTVLQLSHYTSARLASCLGTKRVDVWGESNPASLDSTSSWQGKPAWLVDDGATGVSVGYGDGFFAPSAWRVRVPPTLGSCPQYTSDWRNCPFNGLDHTWIRMTGHFNDPRSATCTATWTGTGPKPSWFTPAYVRTYCRTQFVMDTKPVRTLVLPVNPN